SSRGVATANDGTSGAGSDEPGDGAGHGGIHVAGAGARAGRRRAQRSVLVRRGDVRDGDRPPAVSGQQFGGHLRCDSPQRSALGGTFESRATLGTRAHHHQGVGKGSQAAVSERGGPKDRSDPAETRYGFGIRGGDNRSDASGEGP